MKRIVVISALVTVAITFSGCGGKESGSASKKENIKTESEYMINESSDKDSTDLKEYATENTDGSKSEIEGETRYEGKVNENSEYEIDYVDTNEEEVIVPDTIEDAPVCKINSYAFEGENSVKRIVLPDTIKYVGPYAFSNCDYLEEVEFGKELESVGDMAFTGCDNLRTVMIPEGTTTLGGICNYNPVLTDIYIPASVTEITGMVLDNTCPNAIIVTPAGSYAEAYAIEMGFTYRNE